MGEVASEQVTASVPERAGLSLVVSAAPQQASWLEMPAGTLADGGRRYGLGLEFLILLFSSPGPKRGNGMLMQQAQPS